MNVVKNKVCSRCKFPKAESEFRVRTEKRRGGVCRYLNNTCRTCDAELQREYYKNNREKCMEKARVRSREYARLNSEIIKLKNKIKRQTQRYKENRKRYIAANKEKIFEQEKICKRRFYEKNLINITDTYCIKLITRHNGISADHVTEEMIMEKRKDILIFRLKNIISQIDKFKTHASKER